MILYRNYDSSLPVYRPIMVAPLGTIKINSLGFRDYGRYHLQPANSQPFDRGAAVVAAGRTGTDG